MLNLETADLAISLLAEELKSRKFFNTMQSVGLENSFYQPDLCNVILQLLHLNDHTNETLDFYHHVVEKYSARLEPNHQSALHHALMAYWQLLGERKRRTWATPSV